LYIEGQAEHDGLSRQQVHFRQVCEAVRRLPPLLHRRHAGRGVLRDELVVQLVKLKKLKFFIIQLIKPIFVFVLIIFRFQ